MALGLRGSVWGTAVVAGDLGVECAALHGPALFLAALDGKAGAKAISSRSTFRLGPGADMLRSVGLLSAFVLIVVAAVLVTVGTRRCRM
jgi:hypothetical protein